MTTFTPSSGPRWEKCLGSAVLPQAREDFDSARKGQALHDFMRRLAMRETRAAALAAIDQEFAKDAERIEVPEDIDKAAPEVGLALDLAAGTARALGENMTREQVRERKRPGEIGMLLDRVSLLGDSVLVADPKFGWQEDLGAAKDHLQLLTYTATAMLAFGKGEGHGALWHWDGVRWRVDGVTLDFLGALEVLDRVRRLMDRAAEAQKAYAETGALPPLNLGKWCAWCPALRLCPMRNAAALVVAREDMPTLRSADLTLEEAGVAYQRLKLLKAYAEQGLEDLESIAGQTPIPLPDGTVLRQQEVDRTSLVVADASEWLTRTYGEALATASKEVVEKMTWEGLTDALRTLVLPERLKAWEEKRLPGKKPTLAALQREARSGLEAVGAVTVSTYVQTKPVRPELPSGEEGDVIPIDHWEWDAEAQGVVALDVADKRGGDSVPVDFTDEPCGLLAAAAPDMARALMALGEARGSEWHSRYCDDRNEVTCVDGACKVVASALKKAGVL